MRDPCEGLTRDGRIRTGVSRGSIPPAFQPVISDAVAAFCELRRRGITTPDAALLLYGSVATGMAEPGRSDVDLIAFGVDQADAEPLATTLSNAHRAICREVAIGTSGRRDLEQPGDEAYGNRVFLRHYCVPLAGESPVQGEGFFGDARAARGFNGDIRRALDRWRQEKPADPALLARRIGRKTLLAAAGLVSVVESRWTTDREVAAERWRVHRPELAADVDMLLAWSECAPAHSTDVTRALGEGGVVSRVADDFAGTIGLWDTDPEAAPSPATWIAG